SLAVAHPHVGDAARKRTAERGRLGSHLLVEHVARPSVVEESLNQGNQRHADDKRGDEFARQPHALDGSTRSGLERERNQGVLPKTILVPTDLGDSAEEALDYACELAERFGATVHLLNVIGIPALGVPELGVAMTSTVI